MPIGSKGYATREIVHMCPYAIKMQLMIAALCTPVVYPCTAEPDLVGVVVWVACCCCILLQLVRVLVLPVELL